MSLSPKEFVPIFFDNTSQTYDKVAYWSTFGKDNLWKNEIIKKIQNADSILDLACGTGILTRRLATCFPRSKIVAVDITKNYLEIAEKNSTSFSNVSFVHQDAEKLALDKKFDCICSSYIPKYCDPEILVKNCMNHLNPAGQIILHDFTYPKNYLIQKIWNLYFILLNFIGIFIPSWKEAFFNLPKLIKTSNWFDSYKKEFEKNNFDVVLQNLTWHTSAILVATKTNCN
ncbi:MAG: class I SAM-dependent methyltransferase [Nitrosopumilus sp.]|uniref:class I SAM-dependent methyltransferase n=1 Tax=Nitrosopumilus sp. TaxID=2024843 RepID=UPI00247D5835|nr:class I SAM-dependent methyltransferase [Nitrosopumilus sp.]MCV0391722.1 class I SAM-dependent methyltransferase [Nitrosopumilus sp.]